MNCKKCNNELNNNSACVCQKCHHSMCKNCADTNSYVCPDCGGDIEKLS